jgi:hypothetical protein
MRKMKTAAEWMVEKEISLAELVEASALDDAVVQAIVDGRYTPSPEQRRRLSTALAVGPDEIAWGHRTQVEHVYGHGPQFGRSP